LIICMSISFKALNQHHLCWYVHFPTSSERRSMKYWKQLLFDDVDNKRPLTI
jgi:hypothetical protein